MVSKIPPVEPKNDGSVTYGIGATVQYVENNGGRASLPSVTIGTEDGQSHTTNYYSPMTFDAKKRGVVASPVIDVSYKPIENLAIGARATSTEVGATVCWNF